MGACCCRVPAADDDHKVDEKIPVKDDLNNTGTYGTNDDAKGSPVMKERSVSFEDQIGQNAIGSPPEEASEAVPLLNGTETVPVIDVPKDTAGADTTETAITTAAQKEGQTSEPRDRPTSFVSQTSESSTGDHLASPTADGLTDFMFTGPTTSESDKKDKKKKKKEKSEKKQKKSLFGRKKRSSSSVSASDSVTASETSSVVSSQISGSRS